VLFSILFNAGALGLLSGAANTMVEGQLPEDVTGTTWREFQNGAIFLTMLTGVHTFFRNHPMINRGISTALLTYLYADFGRHGVRALAAHNETFHFALNRLVVDVVGADALELRPREYEKYL